MGFIARLKGEKESRPKVKAVILGAGEAAERLAAGYRSVKDIEFLGLKPLNQADNLHDMSGLQAVEVVAPRELCADIAAQCLAAGLFTSLDLPSDITAVHNLQTLAQANNAALRFRLYPIYYPPYREVKRLVEEMHLGQPLCLKLAVRRGEGTSLPEGFDLLAWIEEHELGYLALSHWLLGPVDKVYVQQPRREPSHMPASTLIMWKYAEIHQYGYLQMDFCPELHIRTSTDPVHRLLELTSVGGVIMVTRGEGQLMRMPVVIIRGKTTATSLETVPDDWREVYVNLARETHAHLTGEKPMATTTQLVTSSLNLVKAARQSLSQGDEVSCQQ